VQRESKLIGADYLLLLLYLNNAAPIKSAVRLIKMMFLFNEEVVPLLKKSGVEIDDDALPEFYAYDFGPFSTDVYEQIELFRSINFIKVTNLKASEEMGEVDDWEEKGFIDEYDSQPRLESRIDGKYMKYELLTRGKDYVSSKILDQVTKEQLSLLEEFKTRISSSSIKSILKYVYTTYPSMIEKSQISDEVFDN
jgi:uncharacterized protein